MTMEGMDADAVRQFAGKLDAQAQSIASVIGSINGLLSNLSSVWRGPDAQQFDGWWTGQHRPALQNAHEALSGLAQSARNNAAAQDAVSSAGAGAPPASGGDAPFVSPFPPDENPFAPSPFPIVDL